jgi:hypothetical protein
MDFTNYKSRKKKVKVFSRTPFFHLFVFKLLVLFLMMVACSVNTSNLSKVEKDAKKTVESFIQAEFNGIEDARSEFVIFSPKRKILEEKREFKGLVNELQYDPLIIVDSYRIMDVRVFNNRAETTAFFTSLAKTKGKGEDRKIISDRSDKDMVKINLVYENNRWWIVDPPLPRVSLEAMIEKFKAILKRSDEERKTTLAGLDEEQIKNWMESYNYDKTSLEILEKLKEENTNKK